MEDKILKVKEEMKRVINTKKLTRLERYDLTKKQCEKLSEKELRLLIKECERNYKFYERVANIKEVVTILLTGIGLFITLDGFLVQEQGIETSHFVSLGAYITIYLVLAVILLTWILSYSNSNMNITRYMLDVLEDCEKNYKKKIEEQ